MARIRARWKQRALFIAAPGRTVTVDLRISDLGDDILTAFDLDVLFDDAILSYDSFAFGTFTFTGIGLGTSALEIDYLELSGAFEFNDILGYEPVKFCFFTIRLEQGYEGF